MQGTDFCQGRNSQNFLRQICKMFVTVKCFYGEIIHGKYVLWDFYGSLHQHLRILSVSKTSLCLKSIMILLPKVMKILRILLKKFCEFPP